MAVKTKLSAGDILLIGLFIIIVGVMTLNSNKQVNDFAEHWIKTDQHTGGCK